MQIYSLTFVFILSGSLDVTEACRIPLVRQKRKVSFLTSLAKIYIAVIVLYI